MGSVVRFENNTSLSFVSGHPARVCICNKENQPQCLNPSYIYTTRSVYPSEILTIPVVVVGGDWGVTTGIVHARFTPTNSASVLQPLPQYTQLINSTQCTALSYNVYGKQSVQLVLSAEMCYDPDLYKCNGNQNIFDKQTFHQYMSTSISYPVRQDSPCRETPQAVTAIHFLSIIIRSGV